MTKVSKKYAYKGVDSDVQNVLKLTYEHLYFQKKFQGWYPDPVKWGREKFGEGDGMERQGKKGKGGTGWVGEKRMEGEERVWEGNWKGEGEEAPPFHVCGYDTA